MLYCCINRLHINTLLVQRIHAYICFSGNIGHNKRLRLLELCVYELQKPKLSQCLVCMYLTPIADTLTKHHLFFESSVSTSMVFLKFNHLKACLYNDSCWSRCKVYMPRLKTTNATKPLRQNISYHPVK